MGALLSVIQLLIAGDSGILGRCHLSAGDEDAEALLQLPAACLADGLVAAQRLGQHKGAEHAEKLDKGHSGGSGGNQHGALRHNEVHLAEAAVVVGLHTGHLGGVVQTCWLVAAA